MESLLDVHGTSGTSGPGPFSRRRFLQAAGVTATAVAATGTPARAASSRT
ncbi:twin-arginine translocation signal domain-containing protein, partial [Streptomyces sp. RP5T]